MFGVLIDSLTGDPVGGARIMVIDIPDTMNNCEPQGRMGSWADPWGHFIVLFGCRSRVMFSKEGYHSKTLLWPDDFAAGRCGCCRALSPIKMAPIIIRSVDQIPLPN
jgi:hypothetical protein